MYSSSLAKAKLHEGRAGSGILELELHLKCSIAHLGEGRDLACDTGAWLTS